jgi:integrase
MLAVLTGCGLRRADAAALKIEDLQLREGHWVIADLNGKGGHIRTVPMPDWVKMAIDQWTVPASIPSGTLFRSINKAGRVWGTGFTPKVMWSIVEDAASNTGLAGVAPHDLRRYAESRTMPSRTGISPILGRFEKCARGIVFRLFDCAIGEWWH